MPFPSTSCSGQTRSESERHRKAVFMQVWRMFAALRLYASDKVRTLPTRAGIEGLRHKQRHSLTDAIEAGNTGRAPKNFYLPLRNFFKNCQVSAKRYPSRAPE